MKLKSKRLLSFFLALICITGITPTTVFASDKKYNDQCYFYVYLDDGLGYGNSKDNPRAVGKLPLQCSSKNFSANDFQSSEFWTGESFVSFDDISNNCIVNVTFLISNLRYNGASGTAKLDVSSGPYSFATNNLSSKYVSGEGTYVTATFNNVVTPDKSSEDYTYNKAFYFSANITGLSCHKSSDMAAKPFYLTISSLTYDVESEQSGFFNKVSNFFSDLFGRLTAWFDSLFQWLKDIRDGNISFSESVKSLFSNITNNIRDFFSELGSKLSEGFSNLTKNISNFFTNLTNSLKDWFNNVGKWFSEIGDRISSFFTNLWNNITGTVTDITSSVQAWWQSVCDWFKALVTVDEGYFDEYQAKWLTFFEDHFGFAWQSIELMRSFIDLLSDMARDGRASGVIEIPAIPFPFVEGKMLLPATTFDFNVFIHQNSFFEDIIYTVRILSSGIFIFATAMFGYSFIRKILGMNGD